MELQAFCTAWLDAWSGNKLASLLEFYTTDVFYSDPAVRDGLKGIDKLAQYLQRLLAANPDWRWQVCEIIPTLQGFTLKWEAFIPVGDELIHEFGLDNVRIDPIHEGTTGIQGQDLLGRKLTMKKGQAYSLFITEVNQAVEAARGNNVLHAFAEILQEAVSTVDQVSKHLLGYLQAERNDLFLGDATLYLEMMGIVTIGWQWLLQGQAAQAALDQGPDPGESNFYLGKLSTMEYYFDYEMPRVQTLARILTRESGFISDLPVPYLVS